MYSYAFVTPACFQWAYFFTFSFLSAAETNLTIVFNNPHEQFYPSFTLFIVILLLYQHNIDWNVWIPILLNAVK